MALTNIVLLRYNNYYNRIKKKKDTLAEYMNLGNNALYTDVNFYKGDGIETQLLLNNGNLLHGPTQSTLNVEDADYLIEYGTGSSIVSRWFVMEALQTRNNQYRLSLKRDVIADNWDSVLDATSYIEKANVNANDIAIYNAEDIDLNVIKTEEILLKEEASVPSWIIGYYKKPNDKVDISVTPPGANAIEVSTLEAWEYYQYVSTDYKYATSFKVGIKAYYLIGRNHYIRTYYTDGNSKWDTSTSNHIYPTMIQNNSEEYDTDYGYFINSNSSNIVSKVLATNPNFKTFDLTKLDGKYLNVTTGTRAGLYLIRVLDRDGSHKSTSSYSISTNTSTEVNTILQNFQYSREGSGTVEPNITCDWTYENKYINLIPTTGITGTETATLTIPADANDLSDAPYRMFCIPYGKSVVRIGTESTTNVIGDKVYALALARAVCVALSGLIIDLQLLPYFPCREWINDGVISLQGGSFSWLKKTGTSSIISYMIFPKYSTFSFDLNHEITLPDSAIERKIVNQCDKYRICSPNYSAIFEFNPLKTGKITSFSIDCTYKPFSPYIHIQPNWGNLYGKDFDDVRGLIVQGDFSMAMVTDKWIEYQLNNKNYLNSFNRQVESIELQNKYAKTSDILNAVTGTAQGGITGAMAGSVGGPIGAVAGGIVGTAAAGVGGVLDVSVNEKLRNESLDLSRDQFNYSLQNIQALPNTLAKVSAFDANNKIFPILEYYTCTDEEKEIFRNKLTYNGMTVMRIGRIADFKSNTQSFIKAQLIRIDLAGDNHMVMNIAAEMNGGMYI